MYIVVEGIDEMSINGYKSKKMGKEKGQNQFFKLVS